MRKTTFLFSFLLMVGMTLFFTACNKDDDDETPDPKYYPTVDFKGGGDYVTGNVTIETGADFHVGIIASMNATSKEKLQGFNITRVINNTPEVIFNEVFNEETYNFDSVFTAVDEAVAANYIFTIIDDDAMETELSFVITTQEPAPQFGEINFYSNVVLGSFGDATGSFYATTENMVYSIAEANTASEKIDFAYFYGATKKATLGAPDDALVNDVFDLDAWTTKNATKFFATDLSPEVFDGMVNDSVLTTFDTFDQSSITNIDGDQVFVFETAAGKKGIVKVISVPVTREDLITFQVKIQK